MKGKGILLASMALGALALGALPAQAALTIVSTNGGAPSAGITRINFDDPLPAGVTMSLTPDAAIVNGSLGGVYAAPFLSGNNGLGFGAGGTDQPNGQDATKYVTTGSTGAVAGAKVTLDFTVAQKYLGLLWGSVDNYNTMEFFFGGSSVGTIVGTQVWGAANGDQGAAGTFYVNINSDTAFDRVVFSSSQYAFEFDNVAFGEREINVVPIPAAAWLLASGLLGLFGLARRRSVA